MEDTIDNIIIQSKVYYENGDEITLDQETGQNSYFSSLRLDNNDRNNDFQYFNSIFCSGFEKNVNKINLKSMKTLILI